MCRRGPSLSLRRGVGESLEGWHRIVPRNWCTVCGDRQAFSSWSLGRSLAGCSRGERGLKQAGPELGLAEQAGGFR